jgi:enoyl-[acyl-carrier protein] reductase II
VKSDMKNVLCERVGIKYPIIQGPMAWCSDSALAAAVSNAGGLGIMGMGFVLPDLFRSEVHKAKSLTDKPFGTNIVLFPEAGSELVDIALQEKVAVIELETWPQFFSMLTEHTRRLKDAGIVVIGKASCVEDAIINEKAGVDFVSVKGADGGGHIFGFTGTFSLIPQIVDTVSIPVINSSGVADGRGVAASFMLGAVGVEIGSRFLLAHECPVHKNYKQAIIDAKEGDTVLTGVSVNDGVRVLRNMLSDKILRIEKECEKEEAIRRIEECAMSSLYKAAVMGDVENEGSVTVGQNVGMLNKRQSAAEIVEEIVSEYERLLNGLSRYL